MQTLKLNISPAYCGSIRVLTPKIYARVTSTSVATTFGPCVGAKLYRVDVLAIPVSKFDEVDPEFSTNAAMVHNLSCIAAFSAASIRTIFSVLALQIQQDYSFTFNDMGVLQSALLWGYIIGQIPAGFIADRYGGPFVLLAGMGIWSLGCLSMAATPFLAISPLLFLLSIRFLIGLTQSVMAPCISAAASQYFNDSDRALKTSQVYAFYSVGTVFGLSIAPCLLILIGWSRVFLLFGFASFACSLFFLGTLKKNVDKYLFGKHTEVSRKKPENLHQAFLNIVEIMQQCLYYGPEILLLCFTHSVIGFTFFVLQSWMPTIIHRFGIQNFCLLGIVSALPWLVAAIVSVLSGRLSNYLQNEQGWPSLECRRMMQGISCFGGALAMLPFCFIHEPSPWAAISLLSLALATQGFNYAGFHSYVADVAPHDSGILLGITNSCSITAGIVGVLLTGNLASLPNGLITIFSIATVSFLFSGTLWVFRANGKPIYLRKIVTKAN